MSLFESPFKVYKRPEVLSTTKRMSVYWYFLAKQNLFLKQIITRVKR